MGVISELLVKLGLESADFRREIRKASGLLKEFQHDVERIKHVVEASFAFHAVETAAHAVAHLVEKGAEATDGIRQLALQSGSSIEKFSQLAVAARISGRSAEDLSKGMVILSSKMSSAAAGAEKPLRAFKQLGFSQEQIREMTKDTGAAFEEITRRMTEYHGGANKVALAREMMGRGGARLVPLMSEEAEFFERSRRVADAFGLTLKDSAALGAKELAEDLEVLKLAGTGFAVVVAEDLAPSIHSFVKRLEEDGPFLENFKTIAEDTATAIKGVAIVAMAAGGSVVVLGKLVAGAAASMAATVRSIFDGSIGWNDESERAMQAAVDDAKKTIGAMSGIMNEILHPSAHGAKGGHGPDDNPYLNWISGADEAETAIDRINKMIDDYRARQVKARGGTEVDVMRFRIDKGDLRETFAAAGSDAKRLRTELINAVAGEQNAQATGRLRDELARLDQAIQAAADDGSELAKVNAKIASDPKLIADLKAVGVAAADSYKAQTRAKAAELDRTTAIKAINEEIQKESEKVSQATESESEYERVARRIANDPKLVRYFRQAGDGAEELKERWLDLAQSVDRSEADKYFKGTIDTMREALAQVESSNSQLARSEAELASSKGAAYLKRAGDNAAYYAREIRALAADIDAARVRDQNLTALEKYNRELARLAKLREVNAEDGSRGLDVDGYAKAVKRTQDDFVASGGVMTEFTKEFSGNIRDILAENLNEGFKKGVGGMLQAWGDMLRKMVMQALAARLTSYLFPALGGGLTGLTNSLGNSVSGTSPQTALDRAGPGVALAKGGPLRANQLAVVGEEGPELFVPNVSGRIIPNERARAELERQFRAGGWSLGRIFDSGVPAPKSTGDAYRDATNLELWKMESRLRRERFKGVPDRMRDQVEAQIQLELDQYQNLRTRQRRARELDAKYDAQPRAFGGDVSAGAMYRVGERGAEIFVPNAARLPGARVDDAEARKMQMQRHEHFHTFDERYMRLSFGDAMNSFLARERAGR